MSNVEKLKLMREKALDATVNGAPARPRNQFFGVGPITDMIENEMDARLVRIEFENWLEQNYPKTDDKGKRIGGLTAGELSRCMHRGYPADKVLLDMVRKMHTYFGFPKSVKMVIGLGGGHSGFTSAIMHLISADPAQQIYIDTPKPESDAGMKGGFFRQAWGTQLIELMRKSENGDESRLHFADGEGEIPNAAELERMGIKLFVGVGHETTGATAYKQKEIDGLLEWMSKDPDSRHALVDATSLLGALCWRPETVKGFLSSCNLFFPYQKAVGGISGYFTITLTPQAIKHIDSNMKKPICAVPRQLKIAVAQDPKKPFSSPSSVMFGPVYCPEKDAMLGGIINTYNVLSFAETTFGIMRTEKLAGTVEQLNARSAENRQTVADWLEKHPLFVHGVQDFDRRGAAVTLLRVNDPDMTDADIRARIIAKSKQLLGFEGLTHPNGNYERPLDSARFINAFPGTPGDYRAWVGGIRDKSDVVALLDNIEYAYLRAKAVVMEEELAKAGCNFEAPRNSGVPQRVDDPAKAYKVLIADLVGLMPDASGAPAYSAVKTYVESKGGEFHNKALDAGASLAPGKIHFFYQPGLSRADEINAQTADGRYDALIAAATFIPEQAQFALGGVRIGAGTGNMGSKSWGGGEGKGGSAPLMNTPGFNSRATAHATVKALLKVLPNIDAATMHEKTATGKFDTGKDLADYPYQGLAGKKIAVLGFGNIGREVARLTAALSMKVTVYARPHHQKWIEAEGFTYSSSKEAAAHDADVISVHMGLGPKDPTTGKFANVGSVNAKILSVMKHGAVVINYDRGELVDTVALDSALASGKISYAAVDADIFRDASTGSVTGPMAPYLDLHRKHPGKLELLPHAAADTEHNSRVEGAKQAVDQIYDVIQFKQVANLKGDLPKGYTNKGGKSVKGIAAATTADFCSLDEADILELRKTAALVSSFWSAFDSTKDNKFRQNLVEKYASDMLLNSARLSTALKRNGLCAPFKD